MRRGGSEPHEPTRAGMELEAVLTLEQIVVRERAF